jgi:cell division protein FtsQ
VSQELFDKRRRSARWRRIGRILLGILVAGLIGTSIWLVWFSTVLNVRQVDVEGAKTLTAAQIRTVAAVPIGGPLARVDVGAVETRVAGMERIDSVEATRRWPHTLTLHVQERTPVAWARIDGQTRLIDRYGIDFRSVRSGPSELAELRIHANDPEVRVKAFESAARVIVFLRGDGRDVFNQVLYFSADTQDSVRLHLSRNRTVVWGSAGKGQKKLVVLRALLKVRASHYDVSAPELPTTKK